MPLYEQYGWESDLPTFSTTKPTVVRTHLEAFIRDASQEQIRAWGQAIPWLQHQCTSLTANDAAAAQYRTILEYQLPRDFRRPDVIFLEHGCVAVVELKGQLNPSQAAIDQVQAYARDLKAYHSACAGQRVIPVLITRGAPLSAGLIDDVYVVAPEGLDALLEKLSNHSKPIVKLDDFLSLDAYSPLPSIVQAARELFNKRPLPLITRARAATEPALEHITAIAHEAAKLETRNLVLLSGVPGSGKTLVGLQLVHAGWLDDLAVERNGQKPPAPAVYLSGNGPLVEVLQHALREAGGGGRTFVQAIKNYVAQFSRPRAPTPPEHLIVFDEAQRAHDAERVAQVHEAKVDKSEPEHLIEFCNRIPKWCVLVALIGDGQAIHAGEEGGTALWADAIRGAGKNSWVVHGPPQFSTTFKNCGAPVLWHDALNLDTEIRFHLTPRVHEFVNGLLDKAPVAEELRLADELYRDGHRFLITRDLLIAKEYLRERYKEAPEARFGLLASSKDKWLLNFNVDNTWDTTRRLRVGPWYNGTPSTVDSCCQLTTVATEFSSQGLELDCALLAWGSDLIWDGADWSIADSRGTRGHLRDPLVLRKNVYRVLLTRGRDGTVVFVPNDDRLNRTFDRLLSTGFRSLDRPD